jgi:hypothetical protein
VTVPALPFEVKPPFPPDDPRWRELAFLRMGPPNDRVWRRLDKFGSHCRRLGTAESPLAFAYVYLARTLKPMNTPDGRVVSFSDFHRALCEEAKHWMQPGGRRTGVIAPRGAGKSVWMYLILPLWAIAHGHRQFFMGYAHSNAQAVNMLDKLRKHLTQNQLLLLDFPELEIPKGGRNNSQLVEVASGRAFATSGIDKVSLGARHDEDRPDILCVDDGEPDEGNYAVDGKEKRLKTIRDIVLPMNPEAVVLLSGTVVMPGSIGHDLVKAALGEPTEDWVAQERFRALYFNAIQDEGTPAERSLWPEKWPLAWLREERDRNPVQYALHYANQPTTRGGRYWQQEDFRYNPHFPLDHFVMYVDPAVVPKEGRDKTAVVVVGTDSGRNRAVVMFARQGHMTGVELGHRIAEYKRNHPEIPLLDVFIEQNQGGELWLQIIKPLVPQGVRVQLDVARREVSVTGERGKFARIESAYAYYQANRVWHKESFTALEALLTAHPRIRNFDLPDALAGALRKALQVR